MTKASVAAPTVSPASHLDSFVHRLSFGDLPDLVMSQARRCVLDLVGTAAAGSATALSTIIRDHAVEHFGSAGRGARMMFDGR